MKIFVMPEEWPPAAKHAAGMALTLRRRAKGWRDNLRSADAWNDRLWRERTLTHIRRDREEVDLLISLARQAAGLRPYPHGLKRWRDAYPELYASRRAAPAERLVAA